MLHRGLEAWGKSLHRFRWVVIVTWIVLIAVSGWLSTHYANVLSGGGWDIPESESRHVKQMLTEQFDGRSETSLCSYSTMIRHKLESPHTRINLLR